MEAILARHVAGQPNCIVEVNHPAGGLVLLTPGAARPEVLYDKQLTIGATGH
jgi:hypothetical protein